MIEPWDQSKWGPLSEENLRRKLMAEGYSSVVRYLYPMGTVFSDHTHSTDKKDSVLEGEFLITLEGKEFLLHAGDSIEVPAHSVHSAQVVGEKAVVSLDAVKS